MPNVAVPKIICTPRNPWGKGGRLRIRARKAVESVRLWTVGGSTAGDLEPRVRKETDFSLTVNYRAFTGAGPRRVKRIRKTPQRPERMGGSS